MKKTIEYDHNDWQIRYLPHERVYALQSHEIGNFFKINLEKSKTCILKFLSHHWSGDVDILLDNVFYKRVCLCNESTRTIDVEVEARSFFETITLVVSGKADVSSEVWFISIEANNKIENAPKPGEKVSDLVRKVSGTWGEFYILENDDTIGPVIATTGQWAPEDIEVFKVLCDPSSVAIDVGANIGHHSVVLSNLVGANGFVYGFEPQRLVNQIAVSNLVLNGICNCNVKLIGLGNKKESIRLFPINYFDKNNFGALGVDVDGKLGELIPVSTLDDEIVEEHRNISFLKIDIQGFDYYCLLGAEQILKHSKPSIFCEVSPGRMNSVGYDFKLIYKFLRDLGYLIFHKDNVNLDSDGYGVAETADFEFDIVAIHPENKKTKISQIKKLGWVG